MTWDLIRNKIQALGSKAYNIFKQNVIARL